MPNFQKVTEQLSFLKANGSVARRLIKLRFDIVSLDFISLQKVAFLSAIMVGVALVFFLMMLLFFLFGLNEAVTDSVQRLWLFFGGAVISMALFIGVIYWVAKKLTVTTKNLNDSVREFYEELGFLVSAMDSEEVSKDLQEKINKLEERS